MTTTQDTQWYEFTAYNSETIYSYGTESEADQYCDHLNTNRESNVYAASVADGEDSEYCDHWNNLEDELAAIAELEEA